MAKFYEYREVLTTDNILRTIQRRIKDAIDPLSKTVNLNTNTFTDIVLSTGQANSIKHGLGYLPSGWRIIRINGNANVWEPDSTRTKTELVLRSSATVTVDIEVF